MYGVCRFLSDRLDRIAVGRADDDGINLLLDEVLDLRDLLAGIGIAAGIEFEHIDAVLLRLSIDTMGARDPEGRSEIGHGEADRLLGREAWRRGEGKDNGR